MSFHDLWSSFFGRPDLMPYRSFVISSPPRSIALQLLPVSVGCSRYEGYVRLPFVDDLRLRGAMQGFLTGDSSRTAKLTSRQTRSSKCQRCHSEKILRSTSEVYQVSAWYPWLLFHPFDLARKHAQRCFQLLTHTSHQLVGEWKR